MARDIRFQSLLPIKFYGICIKVVVYLINRLSSHVIVGKRPCEQLFSKPPNLSHLRTIGCLCHTPVVPKGDKFTTRANPAIMIGYSITQKGYLLMEIATNKFFVSRDVVFQENSFLFAQSQCTSINTESTSLPIEVDDPLEINPSAEVRGCRISKH